MMRGQMQALTLTQPCLHDFTNLLTVQRDTHCGDAASGASPLCVVLQQNGGAAGAAAGAAGRAAGDGWRWAIAGALHRLIQAVHGALLMADGKRQRA